MLWSPKDQLIGDPTIIRVGREYHLFGECSPSNWTGGMGQSFAGIRTVCHAVSSDMYEWRELPTAITCGPPGSFDHYSIYHMDVFVHHGTWYMHYTGLDKGGPGEQQTIGLATSPDGIVWTKHPEDPVLRADPRWYEPAIPREATYQEKDFGRLWFRDPCIVPLADGTFGMIVTPRDLRQHADVRGCIAWATSPDLVHWTAHPPIYSPGRFHTVETPSLFEHGGRWYLHFMTGPQWGTPLLMTDPYQDAGDFYAVSTRGPTGPFEQPADEIVVAAHHDVRMGASRTVDGPDGERYFYGWLRFTNPGTAAASERGCWQAIPPPRRVRFTADGQLQVVYDERLARYYHPRPLALAGFAPTAAEHWRITAESLTGKDFRAATSGLLPETVRDFMLTVRLRFLRGHRAGVLLQPESAEAPGWQVIADRRLGRVEIAPLGTTQIADARQWSPTAELELRVVACEESLEVYVDDRLLLHQSRIAAPGRPGFLVDQAEAQFTHAHLSLHTPPK